MIFQRIVAEPNFHVAQTFGNRERGGRGSSDVAVGEAVEDNVVVDLGYQIVVYAEALALGLDERQIIVRAVIYSDYDIIAFEENARDAAVVVELNVIGGDVRRARHEVEVLNRIATVAGHVIESCRAALALVAVADHQISAGIAPNTCVARAADERVGSIGRADE